MDDAMTVGSALPENKPVRLGRRFRRAETAAPFLPYGLFPLAGLAFLLIVCLTFIAVNVVQASAREATTRALAASGEDWVRFTVSGQWVTLEGVPPSPEAALRVQEAIGNTQMPTWFGPARPVTRVSTRFSAPLSSPGSAAGQANAILSAQAPDIQPEYLFRRSGERVTLDGRLPGEALYKRVMDAARSLQASDSVSEITDQLEIYSGPVPEGFEDIAMHSLNLLAECHNGSSAYIGQDFKFHCEASDDEVGRIMEAAAASLPQGVSADIEVLPRDAVARCEADIAQLLEAARIEFASGSVTIKVASGPLLDLTAHAAADCPGKLRVTGHTDNTGSLELNQELSLRRAEAVRAALIHRGVPADRLVAVGLGPSQPIGDNNTEEGRARNRRIEISIVRPAE